MKIRFECPICNNTMSLKKESDPIGKKAKCTQCDNIIRLSSELIVQDKVTSETENKTLPNKVHKNKNKNNEQTMGSILFSTKGRLSQETYIPYKIITMIIYYWYIVSLLDDKIIGGNTFLCLSLLYFYISICLDIKRLHDLNFSGLWVFGPYLFVPLSLFIPFCGVIMIVAFIVLYVFLFLQMGPERPTIKSTTSHDSVNYNTPKESKLQNCACCGISFAINTTNPYHQNNTCSKYCFHKKKTAEGNLSI